MEKVVSSQLAIRSLFFQKVKRVIGLESRERERERERNRWRERRQMSEKSGKER